MAKYRISGVWKDAKNVITHYAFHEVDGTSAYPAVKRSKAEAVKLLETAGNSAVTWIWNYTNENWIVGQTVEVVNGSNGKFLRSKHDNKVVDNLAHLIDFDWINP